MVSHYPRITPYIYQHNISNALGLEHYNMKGLTINNKLYVVVNLNADVDLNIYSNSSK